MSTTSAETDFETALKACQDAIASGDWATARTQYAVAEAANSRLLARLTQGSVDKTRRERLLGLREAIDYASKGATAHTDQRRMIRTQMGF